MNVILLKHLYRALEFEGVGQSRWYFPPAEAPCQQQTLSLMSNLTPRYWIPTPQKMGRDEQAEEREVLESIFPEEITGAQYLPGLESTAAKQAASDISDTSYRISIALDVTQQDEEESTPRKSCLFRKL